MMKLILQGLLLLQVLAASQSAGTIAGVVRSPEGEPLENVRITTVAVDSGSELRTSLTVSDSSGHFLLQGVPPGRYYIAAGLISYPIYYPGSTSLKDARAIEVRAGTSIENINFSIAHARGLRVSGKVIDESGMPIKKLTSALSLSSPKIYQSLPKPADASPRVTLLADPLATPHTAAIDSSGFFELDGLSPGDYRLWVGGAAGMFPRDIVIADSDISNVTLVVPKIIRIECQIVFEGNYAIPVSAIQFTSVQTTNDFMKLPEGRVIPSAMSAQNGITYAAASGTFAYYTSVQIDSGKCQVSLPSGQYNLKLTSAQPVTIRSVAFGNIEYPPSSLKVDSDGKLLITLSQSESQGK